MIKWSLSTRRFDNKHHQGDLQCLEFEEGSIWGEIKPNVSGPGYVFVVMNGNSPLESGTCRDVASGKSKVEQFMSSRKKMSLSAALQSKEKKLAGGEEAARAKETAQCRKILAAAEAFNRAVADLDAMGEGDLYPENMKTIQQVIRVVQPALDIFR